MTERRLYIPTDYVEKEEKRPVIFINGPIQGAPDWQKDAIELIHRQNAEVIVASPRREYISDTFEYVPQVNWETYHRRLAGKTGVNMFWLAAELTELHDPTRAYAQTTRAELFESKVRHELLGEKMIVGIENGFSGSRYIRHRFEEDCPDVPIVDTLEATVEEALRLL